MASLVRFRNLSKASRHLFCQRFDLHTSPVVLSKVANLTIGDVTKELRDAPNPELVPQKYVHESVPLSQSALHHLRWMLQKDIIKQDMFLLGQPGPLRRQLAMQFLELTQREFEYIALSRDTTESDLKQRREIKNKAAVYYDQCAVRAAVNGRVLILDGVEHVERNVLPILNNLLENREMHLENGQFLMAPERYDALRATHTKEQLDNWGLLRVSEEFRVIALGCPTHKYKGTTPLDPPFRSRFQSRNVTHYAYDEMLSDLQYLSPNVPLNNLNGLLSFGMAIQSIDKTVNLPDFPLDNLQLIAKLMNSNSSASMHDAIVKLYPYKTMLKKESKTHVSQLFETLKISPVPSPAVQRITATKVNDAANNSSIDFAIDKQATIRVAGGAYAAATNANDGGNVNASKFVDLQSQRNTLAGMIQSLAVGDICLLGSKGVGKMTLAKELIRLLNQRMEPIVLYEDMTSRDLIQQRVTNNDGDTIWRDSPLVRAAKSGAVAVLNGIHSLHKSTATVLQRLIHDRELQLCDGSSMLRHDRYEALLQRGDYTAEQLAERGIFKIHESFRIVALAEPPNFSSSTPPWLSSEMLTLFLYQEVHPLRQSDELEIIRMLYGNAVDANIQKIIDLSHLLRESNDSTLQNIAGTLSTRQLLKIARRISAFPSDASGGSTLNSAHEIVQNVFLTKFMPPLARAALTHAMGQCDIKPPKQSRRNDVREISTENGVLRIGSTTMPLPVTSSDEMTKVPSTLFYEIPQHVELLESLLQDFIIGEHLLLVGNQGVGKNKLTDKLLQLMQRPREYIQLHRDTTVHSLTVQSTLRDGQVVFEDSPLVKAVTDGRVLVVDEADKAPINVTCILRTLVENGEMTLSDGRKIVAAKEYMNSPNDILMHPNFRMIVLANRPGFPFMGNDFFASLSDVFSCHIVSNPSSESEIYLLQQYGPSVPRDVLKTLVNAFSELRQLADEGILNYPYSTREVVNIVKHLERYPNDVMSEVVGNILDFDRYQPEALEQVTQILVKYGLPIETYARDELYELRKKRKLEMTVNRVSGLGVTAPKYGKVDPKNEPHVGGNTWAGGTGGRDTAGLGGKGGPFRLDAGHKVHQLSDMEKDSVPEEVKRAAREINRKAFEAKLKEIKMSEHDHKLYAQFSEPIRKHVQKLKAVLDSMQTKSKERQWQKYQTHGELDDTRLIEGITGEKNIYRRRGKSDPWANYSGEKPNRLKLVVDVSGSMYRFNGYDGRLDRELEAVVMVMEAFEGYEKKIVYDIVGHSGEGYSLPFVNVGSPPKTDKERFETIRMMHAHSQFCWSGDSTVKAIEDAAKSLVDEDYDNTMVVVLSDANLARYGIQPKYLVDAMGKGEPKVKTHLIFIGGLEEELDEINAQMPVGRSFVCMDLATLPLILQQIFTSSLL